MKDQTWSRSHSEEIRRVFGPFPASAASNACNIVKRIIPLLPENWSPKIEEDDSNPVKEFGHNIAFKYIEPSHDPNRTSHSSSSGYDSLSDEEFVSSDSHLISGLLLDAGTTNPAPGPSTGEGGDQAVVSEPSGGKYSGDWLKKQCQSCSEAGIEWQEMCSAVFDVLSSSEDNSAIENNVRMYVCKHTILGPGLPTTV